MVVRRHSWPWSAFHLPRLARIFTIIIASFANVACPEAAHLIAGRQQVIERAGRGNCAVLEQDDVVGTAQGGATMGNHKDGWPGAGSVASGITRGVAGRAKHALPQG